MEVAVPVTALLPYRAVQDLISWLNYPSYRGGKLYVKISYSFSLVLNPVLCFLVLRRRESIDSITLVQCFVVCVEGREGGRERGKGEREEKGRKEGRKIDRKIRG